MVGRVEPAGTNPRRQDNAPRNAVPGQIMPNVRKHGGPLEPRPALGPNQKQPTNDARPNRIASAETIGPNVQTEVIHVQTSVRRPETNVDLVPTNSLQRRHDNIAATIAKVSVTNHVTRVEIVSRAHLANRFVATTDRIRERLGLVVETNGAGRGVVEQMFAPNIANRGKTARTVEKNGRSNATNGLVGIKLGPRETALHHAPSTRNAVPRRLRGQSFETNVLR